MKVVIAIPVLYVGGTEMQTLSLVKVLRAAGFDVTVCCYYEWHEPMVRQIEAAGAEVVLLDLSRNSGLLSLLTELVRFFRRAAPHVVHVQYIAPGLIPVVAARLVGISTVFATVHQPGDRFGMRERFLLSIAARLCTAFFSVSKAVEESWFGSSALFSLEAANRGRRHFTIYNGVDVHRGHGQDAQVPPEELKAGLGLAGKRVIGIVGRVRSEKGHALLLTALPVVLNDLSDVGLLVVGDGPDRGALLEQARALGVEPYIVWAGERSVEEVRELYSVIDVVAVPSRFEGFGLSAAEAMAAGRPVVGTRVGGLPEIIEDGVTGYLIAPDDSAAFAAALVRLLSDPRQATDMGKRGRLRIAEHLSSEKHAEAMVAVYRYFLEGKACSGGAPASPPPAP